MHKNYHDHKEEAAEETDFLDRVPIYSIFCYVIAAVCFISLPFILYSVKLQNLIGIALLGLWALGLGVLANVKLPKMERSISRTKSSCHPCCSC